MSRHIQQDKDAPSREVPDGLPEGWTWARLSEVTTPVPNIRPENEPTRVFRYADISSVSNETFSITDPKSFRGSNAPSRARRPVLPHDTLFSNVRTYLRNIALVQETPAVDICSTGFTVLRPNGAIDPHFLFRYVLTDAFIDAVTPHQTGTHYPATSDRVVFSQRIPLPPLAEQKRIVAKVESLLAKVQSARARLARVPLLFKRLRQSILAAACDGRLTTDWRVAQDELDTGKALACRVSTDRAATLAELRRASKGARSSILSDFDNIEPAVRDDLELSEIPDEWIWVDLRFVMSPDEPFCYGVVQPGKEVETGPRLVRVCDIEDGSVQMERCRTISERVHAQYGRSQLRGGEVLVSVVGTIGRSAVAPAAVRGFNIARAVAKLPVREFNAHFVRYWLGTSLAQSWMVGDAREVARKTLNLEQLRTLPCPLPSRAEQDEIVRRVESLFNLADAIERRVAAATARADKLTQAILAKAFRGELVPTEADLARAEGRDYEPATAMLARIRSEQAVILAPSGSAARDRVRSRVERGQIVLDILLLLEAWKKPVSIMALEPGLVLMRNDSARETLLADKGPKPRRKQSHTATSLIQGLDGLYSALEQSGAIQRVGNSAFKLAKPELLVPATAADRARAREVIRAVSVLGDIRTLPVVVAGVTHERYEVGV